jgi:hypothetical protein
VQHGRARNRIVVDRHGHEEIPRGRAAGEDLAAAHAVAAFHLVGPARTGEPVGSAAGHEDQLLGGDPPQQRLDRAVVVPPAPGRDGDLVGMHRERQGGRAAVVGERAQHLAELGLRGAAASQLGRHPGREDLLLAELGVVDGHEGVVGVVGGGPGGEPWSEVVRDGDPVGADPLGRGRGL